MARGATHVLGLDIGTQVIKAVELKLAGGEIHLIGRPVVVPTPDHSVSGGRVVDTAALSEALTDLVSRSGFGVKKVVASVGGDTDVVVRIIEVPKMTGKELEEAIQWELERQAPFPVDQAVYDYRPIERDDAPADAQNMEVLLAVAQEEMVDAHVETIMAAKLTPIAVDVEPLAIARALVDASRGALASQTIVNVHIGASNTAIMIVRKGLLAFVRTIPTAGTVLTSAIRQNMAESEQQAEEIKRLFADLTGSYAFDGGTDDSYAGNSAAEDTSSFDAIGGFEEAADSVFEVSDSSQAVDFGNMELDEAATQLEIDGGSQAFALPPDQTSAAPTGAIPTAPVAAPVPAEVEAVQSEVYGAIAQPLIDLATEVRRSLDFYRRNHRNEEIDRVLMSGGTASIPGIAAFMGGELGMHVEVADPFEYVVVDEDEATNAYLRDVAPFCVIAVGLAMRDMPLEARPAPAPFEDWSQEDKRAVLELDPRALELLEQTRGQAQVVGDPASEKLMALAARMKSADKELLRQYYDLQRRANEQSAQGNPQQEIGLYQEMQKLAPWDAIAVMSEGVVQVANGDKKQGLKLLRQAERLDPNNPRIAQALADAAAADS